MNFAVDNAWQCEMRDCILVPYFYSRNEYELIDPKDPRAAGGCDTILAGKWRIDEKIVRWPERDWPYDAFALETMSCTVPGREREGWMKTNVVHFLLYCFASKDEKSLDAYLIPFPPLQTWFWQQDPVLMFWPLWTSDQINRTQCLIVPIVDVMDNVKGVRHKVLGGENAQARI